MNITQFLRTGCSELSAVVNDRLFNLRAFPSTGEAWAPPLTVIHLKLPHLLKFAFTCRNTLRVINCSEQYCSISIAYRTLEDSPRGCCIGWMFQSDIS